MKSFLSLLFIALSSAAMALDNFFLGGGLINEHLGQVQIHSSGEKNKFEHRLFFNTGFSHPLNATHSWQLIAEGGALAPGDNQHIAISRNSFFINALLAWRPGRHWQYHLGTGLFMTVISGDGGELRLPNGGGLDDFPIPKGTSVARNITTVAGLSFFPQRWYSLKLQGYLFNIANSRNRTFSYTLSFHYHFHSFPEIGPPSLSSPHDEKDFYHQDKDGAP